MTCNQRLIQMAKHWLNTPFHSQGRQYNIGCDCFGLILGIAYEMLIKSRQGKLLHTYDLITYDPFEDSQQLLSFMKQHFYIIDEVILGSILLIKITEKQYHLCIVSQLNPIKIIHCCSTIGRVCEHRLPYEWKNTIVAIYTINNYK